MITRKDLVVSILCTFCLTTVLFTMMPVQSAEWDPWLDVKEDGRINVLDLIKTASALGTMGDTTKNVTIAGHSNKLAFNVSITVGGLGGVYETPWISVDGYSKVTICISTDASENFYRLQTSHFAGPVFMVDEATSFGTYLVKTYDVPNEQIQVTFINNAASLRHLYLDVYLIP